MFQSILPPKLSIQTLAKRLQANRQIITLNINLGAPKDTSSALTVGRSPITSVSSAKNTRCILSPKRLSVDFAKTKKYRATRFVQELNAPKNKTQFAKPNLSVVISAKQLAAIARTASVAWCKDVKRVSSRFKPVLPAKPET